MTSIPFYKQLTATLVLLCFGFLATAASMTVEGLKAEMKKSYQACKSIQFNYAQSVRSTMSNEIRSSSGTFYFKSPNLLKIEQKSPEQQWIVCNGNKVTVYTPRFKQATRYSWEAWAEGNFFLLCLTGSKESLEKLEKGYQWTIENKEAPESFECLEVHLEPAHDKIENGSLRLWVHRADFFLRKIEWCGENGLSFTTDLKDLIVNPELKKSLFNFKEEPTVEIFNIK